MIFARGNLGELMLHELREVPDLQGSHSASRPSLSYGVATVPPVPSIRRGPKMASSKGSAERELARLRLEVRGPSARWPPPHRGPVLPVPAAATSASLQNFDRGAGRGARARAPRARCNERVPWRPDGDAAPRDWHAAARIDAACRAAALVGRAAPRQHCRGFRTTAAAWGRTVAVLMGSAAWSRTVAAATRAPRAPGACCQHTRGPSRQGRLKRTLRCRPRVVPQVAGA